MRVVSVLLVLVWMLAIGLLLGMAHMPEKVAPLFARVQLDAERSMPYLIGMTFVVPLLLLWAMLRLHHSCNVTERQLELYGLNLDQLETDLATLEAMDEVALNDVEGLDLTGVAERIAALKKQSLLRGARITNAEREWPVRLQVLQKEVDQLNAAFEQQRTNAATLKGNAASVMIAVTDLEEAAEKLGFKQAQDDVAEAEPRVKALTERSQAFAQLPARLAALQETLTTVQADVAKLTDKNALSELFRLVDSAMSAANDALDTERSQVHEIANQYRGYSKSMRLSEIADLLQKALENLGSRLEGFKQFKTRADGLSATVTALAAKLESCTGAGDTATTVNKQIDTISDELDTAEQNLRDVVNEDDDYEDDMSPDAVLDILNRDATEVQERANALQKAGHRLSELQKLFAGNGEVTKTST